MNSTGAVSVQHFSDILCVWAYVSEVRVDELTENFGADIRFDFHYFQVFGDVPAKLAKQWADRGGTAGYAEHVREVAARFDHVQLHPDVWKKVVPVSSMPAHLLLCAVRSLDNANGTELLPELARRIRQAFFVEARDISQQAELLAILNEAGLDSEALEAIHNSGQAHAELSADLSMARDKHITSSPTLLFNEDRQRLSGNVGYRVMEANVRELLQNPADQQSWC